jgi:hypothetical protein
VALKYSMLDHQLVYVVVEAILNRRAQSARPHRPHTVARTPMSIGRHSNTVRIQTKAELEVLNIYRIRPSLLLAFVRLLYSHRHDPP